MPRPGLLNRKKGEIKLPFFNIEEKGNWKKRDLRGVALTPIKNIRLKIRGKISRLGVSISDFSFTYFIFQTHILQCSAV